jgi:hypothetical protein
MTADQSRDIDIFTEKIANLCAIGFRKQRGAQIGFFDGIGILQDQPSSDLKAFCRHPKRKGKHECNQSQHGSHKGPDRRIMFMCRLPTSVGPHLEACFKGQEDYCNGYYK